MKRLMFIAGLALFCTLLAIVPLRADPIVKDYEALKDVRDFRMFIFGVGEGFVQANTDLDMHGQRRLYCQPPKLALQVNNYLDLLEKKMKELKASGKALPSDTPLAFLLLHSLQEAFPCGK